MKHNLNRNKVVFIEKINLALFFIFIFSFVTMRGVMNISIVLLCLSTLILFFLKNKNDIFKSKWFLMIMLSYPLAILLNGFSPIKLEGIKNTADKFYYPLFFFILLVNNFDYKYKKWFILTFEIAMIIGCIWSFYLYFHPSFAQLHYPGEDFVRRVRSFESIGRWGVYLMMAIVLKYSELFLEKSKVNKIYDVFYLIVISYAMLLNNGRGAWLCMIIGLLFFIILSMEKKVIFMSILLTFVAGVLAFNIPQFNKFIESAKSIGNKEEISNKIRLETWRVGFDIAKENPLFGVGYEKNQKYVLEYREKMKETKSKEYVDKYLSYVWVIEGSYLAIVAQNGFLYLIYYMGSVISLILMCYVKVIKMKKEVKIELLGMLSSIVAYYFLQHFYLDLFSYSVYLVYFFLFLVMKKLSLETIRSI